MPQTAEQADVLSAFVPQLSLARGIVFAGPVASFSDANQSTAAAQFVASINWGDGHVSVATVSGAGGSFAVSGRHKYAKNGHYTIRVAITMTRPGSRRRECLGRGRREQLAQASPARAGHSSNRQEARETRPDSRSRESALPELAPGL